MQSLTNFINESLYELYHFTNAGNLIGIIEKDEWVCSVDDNDEIYISTTRSKNGGTGYPTQLIDDTNVIRIVFDGKKLNTKYKIKPVDKMHGKRMAIKANWTNPECFDSNKHEIMKQGNVESEDRVFINSETIQHVHKYIKSIHIDLGNLDPKYIEPIEKYCRKFDIELKQYENTQKFNIGR